MTAHVTCHNTFNTASSSTSVVDLSHEIASHVSNRKHSSFSRCGCVPEFLPAEVYPPPRFLIGGQRVCVQRPDHAHPLCSHSRPSPTLMNLFFYIFFVAGFQVRLFWFEHPLLLHFEDDFWHKLLSINITDWVINWETSNKRQLRLENNFYLKYKLTERDILKLNNDRLYIYSSMCLYFFVIS